MLCNEIAKKRYLNLCPARSVNALAIKFSISKDLLENEIMI